MKKAFTLYISLLMVLVLAAPGFSYALEGEKDGEDVPKPPQVSQPYEDQFYIAPKGKLKIGNPTILNQPRATTKSSSKVRLAWNKDSSAQGYQIQQYKNKRWKTIKTIHSRKKCSYTTKKLKGNTTYSFRVLSFSVQNGQRVFTPCGLPVSANIKETATQKEAAEKQAEKAKDSDSKKKIKNVKKQKKTSRSTKFKCNIDRISVSKTSITIKHLASKKIRARAIKPKRTKKRVADTSIRYFSTNAEVAAVSPDGTITGVRTGKCTVYAIAHNGKKKAITVYVSPNPKVNATEIPIFTFHRIVNDEIKKTFFPENEWVESVSAFEAQLKYLSKHGYKTITLKEFDDWYHGKKTVPEHSVVLTFDDGTYDAYHLAYPILKKHNMTATVFVIGANTPDVTPEFTNDATNLYLGRNTIEKLVDDPYLNAQSHSWGLHSCQDGTRMIYWKNREEIKADFVKMKQEFGFEYMAFPYGHYTNYADEVMPETDVKLAFAFGSSDYARKSDNPYQIRRIKITENTSENSLAKWLGRY